jgi:hypothetical protein
MSVRLAAESKRALPPTEEAAGIDEGLQVLSIPQAEERK